MSLWGRTVITSLASAIPLVGTSIVNWLWGGFSVIQDFQRFYFAFCEEHFKNTNMKICFFHYVEKNNYFVFWAIFVCHSLKTTKVKTLFFIKSQFADVWGKKIKYNSTPASQRLNAKEHALLVGLYEGDGWFQVNKNGKYVQYEFGIQLHKRDLQLLHQIKTKYNLSGTVKQRKDRPDNFILRIRKKADLINKIIPIFDNFAIMGPKQMQYVYFKYHLVEKQTIYFKNLTNNDWRFVENSPQQITQKDYFDQWLVGFTMAEGGFHAYQPKRDKYKVCCFELSQTFGGSRLLNAVKFRLKLNQNVFQNKKTLNWKLKARSSQDCKRVVAFFRFTKPKLMGYKRVQYIRWIKTMKTIYTYRKIRLFPI